MRTLRYLFAFIISTSFFSIGAAQNEINVKYGIHVSSVVTQDAIDIIDGVKTPLTSHFAEITFGRDIHPLINVSTGISYKRKGFGMEYTLEERILGINIPLGIRAEVSMKSVSIPIKLKYKLPIKNIDSYAIAGGGYAFHLSPQISTTASLIGNIDIASIPTTNLVNKGEGFAQFGLGVAKNVGSGRIFSELSYEHSLQNYTSDLVVDIPLRNRGFTVGVGYSMPF